MPTKTGAKVGDRRPPSSTSRPTTSAPAANPASPLDTPLRPRRQPRWIIIGILLTCLGGLGAVVLYQNSSTVTDVVVVTRPVSRGDVVQAADLATRQVGSLNGVSSVPAAALPGLIGQQALVDLSPGLLPTQAVGVRPLPDGRIQVGLKLLPGRLPAGDLPPGTEVTLIAVAAPGERAQDATSQEASDLAPVTAVVMSRPTMGPDQNSWILDVHVDAELAPDVAALAAGDRLVLVRSR